MVDITFPNFYSRHMAKKLIAENQMLHHRLMALDRPVMSRSPLLTAIMARSEE